MRFFILTLTVAAAVFFIAAIVFVILALWWWGDNSWRALWTAALMLILSMTLGGLGSYLYVHTEGRDL